MSAPNLLLCVGGLLMILSGFWPAPCPVPPIPSAQFRASLLPGEKFVFRATETSEASEVSCSAVDNPDGKVGKSSSKVDKVDEPRIALLPDDPSYNTPDAPPLPPAVALLPRYGVLLPQPPYSPPVIVPAALPLPSTLGLLGLGLFALLWRVGR